MAGDDVNKKVQKLEARVKKLEKAISSEKTQKKQIVKIKKVMLNMTEAAEFLGLEVSGLRMLTHKKLIPYYKPNGKTCYFDPEELKDWQHRERQRPVYEEEDVGTKIEDNSI